MASKEPSEETQAAWGKQFADTMASWPSLQRMVTNGIDKNPSSLIASIETGLLSPEREALQAIFNAMEAGFQHLQNSAMSECEELIQANTALKNQTREQQAIVNTLRELNTVSRTSNVTAPALHRRATTDPDKFDGSPSKTAAKRQTEYKNWKHACKGVFALDRPIFDTAFKRLMYLSSMMKGEALDTYRELLALTQEYPDDTNRWKWQDENAFFATLDRHYVVTNEELDASTKFDNIRMGTRTYPEFAPELLTLAQKAHKSKAETVRGLRTKISQALATQVSSLDVLPGSEDVDGWHTVLSKKWDRIVEDAHLAGLRDARGALNHAARATPTPTFTTNQTSPNEGDPMVLDAMRPTRTDCIQQRLCFYCKKPGHGKIDCEEKKRNDAKFGRAPFTHQMQSTPQGQPATRFGPPRQHQWQPQHPSQYSRTSQQTFQNFPPRQQTPGAYGTFRQRTNNPYYNRAMEEHPQGFIEGELASRTGSNMSQISTPASTQSPPASAPNVCGSKNA